MKKTISLAFLSFILLLAVDIGAETESPAVPVPTVPVIRTRVEPSLIRLGDPLSLQVALTDTKLQPKTLKLYSVSNQLLGESVFFPAGLDTEGTQLFTSIIAVPTTSSRGPGRLRVEYAILSEPSGTALGGYDIPISIEGRSFVREEIALGRENTQLRTLEDEQKYQEALELRNILSRFNLSALYARGAFLLPLASQRRTSFFGDRRIYRYDTGKSDTSIHAGIDFGVPRGTEVHASASGRVVLARERIVTGNSVVIEHLPGVFSLYYHLDRIDVAEDSLLEAGALLGLSGSTGLSTGPHLHWEIRVAGEACDPDAFVARDVGQLK
ncbi:M23 family metallopeptidase [Treponema sp.]